MYNAININGIHPSFAAKKKKISRFSNAPAVLPAYSLNEELEAKNEFCRYVKDTFYKEEKTKKRFGTLKIFIAAAAAIAGLLFLSRGKA